MNRNTLAAFQTDPSLDTGSDSSSDSSLARESSDPAAAEREHGLLVTQLFERHRRALLRYLRGLLKSSADAEDVLQEAYARLLDVPALDPTPARARAYLFKVATNLAHDKFRRRKRMREEGEDRIEEAGHENPEGIVDFEQGLDAIERALRDLKPRCRQVFLMRAADEQSYDAIAQALGVSKRTVEREMQHALEVCQKRLKRVWK